MREVIDVHRRASPRRVWIWVMEMHWLCKLSINFGLNPGSFSSLSDSSKTEKVKTHLNCQRLHNTPFCQRTPWTSKRCHSYNISQTQWYGVLMGVYPCDGWHWCITQERPQWDHCSHSLWAVMWIQRVNADQLNCPADVEHQLTEVLKLWFLPHHSNCFDWTCYLL